MKDLIQLKWACDAAINDPSFAPKKDIDGNIIQTYCNMAVQQIANVMGCHDFDGMIADDIAAKLALSPVTWPNITGDMAFYAANQGQLVIAAMSAKELEQPHGHVAIVYPGQMGYSESLEKMVPMVANVGRQNAAEKESLAFPVALGEPHYYAWMED